MNLAQAKLLYLDAVNNDKASAAVLSTILGFPTLKAFELVNDTEPTASWQRFSKITSSCT